MPISRRAFVRTLGVGGTAAFPGALVAARGLEALEAGLWPAAVDPSLLTEPEPDEIRIDSNENPLGPSQAAIDAMLAALADAGRYPKNSRPSTDDLKAAIARKLWVRPENILLGVGSREILRNAVRAFTSPTRALVTGSPSYEVPPRTAEQIGSPVKLIPVDRALRLDLNAMATAAQGARLVYLCNPNNPTATVHTAKAVADFVARVTKDSPDTAILIDEAYHDYVTDPSYATAQPLALAHPNVFITRTFSKAHGMAGLRVGYAVGQVKAIETLARYGMQYGQNVLGLAAAMASLNDPAHIERERARNTEVRKFIVRFFESADFKVTDSQANFVFVDIGRPAKEFREACQQHKVFVGREFPPLEKTHVRISIGTMDEMRRAAEVFRKVLGITSAAGARG